MDPTGDIPWEEEPLAGDVVHVETPEVVLVKVFLLKKHVHKYSIFTGKVCNELLTSSVLFSGDAIYFRGMFNPLNSLEENCNGHSKFSGFFRFQIKFQKPADDNKHGSRFCICLLYSNLL